MECKCTFHQRMNGDGCDICNPAKALEICREGYADLEKAARRLVEAVRSNVNGIDETQAESDNGWWETSTGAEFGEKILRVFEERIAEVEDILGEG